LPVVQTEHFSFTKGEIVYMIAALSSNLGSYGVDGTKSLREQPYPAEEGKSWFDIISRDALGYAEEILLVCEDAQAGGLKLTEADEQEIVGIKETYTSSGESYGWDLDTYCQQVYGTNIRWAHIESFLRKSALANQVQKQISAMAFSQEELEKEFSANPKNYGLIDFYSVNFGDGEVIPQEVLDTAREAVKSSRNLEEFTAAVKTFLLAVKDPGEIESGGGIDAFTQQYLKTGQRTKVAYQNAEFFDWAFGDGVKEGDTFLVENEQTKAPYAYYLLRTPYKDTTVTVDIRHILFAVKDYKTAEEARSKADQIYADWVA
ncbi:MAG: hypothetical protein J6H18_04065, partial [Lachnospiraceae bacterium]|nr:hypothetical protein [Lachnospiraceae bacterium]